MLLLAGEGFSQVEHEGLQGGGNLHSGGGGGILQGGVGGGVLQGIFLQIGRVLQDGGIRLGEECLQGENDLQGGICWQTGGDLQGGVCLQAGGDLQGGT